MAYKGKRSGNMYDPKSKTPYKLSRSRIDVFLKCPRCFYIDRRLGVDRPPSCHFTLNSAVERLVKKEFDIHRAKGSRHPLMKSYGIDAVPYQHEKMNEWRDALHRGITYLHKETNLLITGGIDDVWINPKKELHIVDYKATSKDGEVNLDADWQKSYKWQMEVYQWLFKKNGFKVSKTGYFVYCNGDADKEAFDGRLEFDVKVIPYEGDDSWVEGKIVEAYQCLLSSKLPKAGEKCDYCTYVKHVAKAVGANAEK